MKKSHHKTVLATVLATVVTASFSASALPGKRPLAQAPSQVIGKLIRMADKLGLEERQIVALEDIREAHYKSFRAMRKARRENRRAMGQLAESDNIKTADIEAVAQVKGELEAQAFLQRFAIRQEIKAVLTDEQLDKAKRFRQHRRQTRHQGG